MKPTDGSIPDPKLVTGIEEPVLEEIVADALDPYTDALTPEQVSELRAFLRLYITTHPSASRRYERLRTRAAMTEGSAEVARGGAPEVGATSSPVDARGKKVG